MPNQTLIEGRASAAVRWVRVVPALVLLILAAIGYWLFIPTTHVEASRLSQLVLTRPGVGFKTKPTQASKVPNSSSPFSTFMAAATRSPNSTGAYATSWAGSGSSSDVASMLVSLLPSGSDAATVVAEAKNRFLGPQSLQSESYGLEGPFAVSAVPGAAAATFASTPSSGGKRLAIVVFRVDRVVVLDIVQTTGDSARAATSAASLGHAEYQHLRQRASAFSLVQTSWPLVASLVYGIVAIALVVAVFFAPGVIGWIRRRRRLAREEAAKREYRQRGQKIVKRQAVSRR